jgi:hypothetical protein
MDVKTHWEKVYKTKAPDTISWYLPHLETSFALIERTDASLSSFIIDVGGESTLADDLVSRGYQSYTLEYSPESSRSFRSDAISTSHGTLCIVIIGWPKAPDKGAVGGQVHPGPPS